MESKQNAVLDLVMKLVSHDLRSPFASMIGVMNLLIDDYYQMSDLERLDFMRELLNSSKLQLGLLDRIALLSRFQCNALAIHHKRFSDLELVRFLNSMLGIHQVDPIVPSVDRQKIAPYFELDTELLSLSVTMLIEYFAKGSPSSPLSIVATVTESDLGQVCLRFSEVKLSEHELLSFESLRSCIDVPDTPSQIWIWLSLKILALMGLSINCSIDGISSIPSLYFKPKP